MSDFGKNLRAIRLSRGLSQEELASLLGTSKQVISRYENGQRSPKISVASEYARKLNVSLRVLNGDPDAPHEQDDFSTGKNAPVQQDERTAEVIRLFGSLDPEHQETMIQVLRGLLADQKTSRGSQE